MGDGMVSLKSAYVLELSVSSPSGVNAILLCSGTQLLYSAMQWLILSVNKVTEAGRVESEKDCQFSYMLLLHSELCPKQFTT